MNCRFCKTKLDIVFADLKQSSFANSYLNFKDLKQMEVNYPLCAYVCKNCFLVQLDEFENPSKIFTNYAYFSSYSSSWLQFVKEFSEKIIKRFSLDEKSKVIEIASNDGYLLQFFRAYKIPVLGIEPAENIAKVANQKGILTITKFFGSQTANELVQDQMKADVLIAFNVLPHTPKLNDFIEGLKLLLKKEGVLIIQFSAYLLRLIQDVKFDSIYHEHFSYFSLFTLNKIFTHYGLTIFDVEEFDVHGGSLRLYIKHIENNSIKTENSVAQKINDEKDNNIDSISTYQKFQQRIVKKKIIIKKFFDDVKNEKKKIIAYGAAAKGNTFLNYCEIGLETIQYVVDISPHKQGLYMPGNHLPIYHPDKILETKPDYVVILAWNLKDEIQEQMKIIREWGGKFVVFFPEVKVF